MPDKRSKFSFSNLFSGSQHVLFHLRETTLLLSFAIAIYLMIALVSYNTHDPSWSTISTVVLVHNAGGRVGAYLADIFYCCFGFLAYSFPLVLFYLSWVYFRQKHSQAETRPIPALMLVTKFLGFFVVLVSATALLALHVKHFGGYLPYHSGGIIGTVIEHFMVARFNNIGTTLLLATCFLLGFSLLTSISWLYCIEWIGLQVVHLWASLRDLWANFDFSEFTQTALPQISWREKISWPWVKAKVITEEQPSSAATVEEKPESELSRLSHLNPAASASTSSLRKIKTPRYSRSKAMPKLSLLKSYTQKNSPSVQENNLRSKELERCLLDFGIEVKVAAVYPGPVVTRYEVSLAAGTKVSKITALVKDLARSLSVTSVRVVEVIPGKAVIGIELPNEKREIVGLQDVLASNQYKNFRSPETLALGKDIAGHPVVVDLAKMPHLLVAGTTGSGKSVSLNAMLLSLLYKSTPEQLRLILIDPKMLELSVYDGIPHLLTPVVTDMKDAASALRWCVAEMERRYRLMAALGVRNVAGYNAKVKEARLRGAPLLDSVSNNDKELETLPLIVVIADEFADMMVVVGKKVETLITRLAQKARAAGINLILATQRPSVDVITGLIKANIPTRIAFQVPSKVDSRTILDQQGAEQLLGYGDMLYLPPGSGLPVRVHGAFVSDEEVHAVVSHLKEQAKPEYLEDILDESLSRDPSGYIEAVSGDTDGEQDSLYDDAVAFIAKARKVSVSSIQRRFKIGYNRAARIVETMEAAKVVSPAEGFAAREVLVPPPRED